MVTDLTVKVKKLEEYIVKLENNLKRGKDEHCVSLLLIHDLKDDLPEGWTRKYDKAHNRFLYVHSTRKINFWSAETDEPECDLVYDSSSDLDDLHPSDYIE